MVLGFGWLWKQRFEQRACSVYTADIRVAENSRFQISYGIGVGPLYQPREQRVDTGLKSDGARQERPFVSWEWRCYASVQPVYYCSCTYHSGVNQEWTRGWCAVVCLRVPFMDGPKDHAHRGVGCLHTSELNPSGHLFLLWICWALVAAAGGWFLGCILRHAEKPMAPSRKRLNFTINSLVLRVTENGQVYN